MKPPIIPVETITTDLQPIYRVTIPDRYRDHNNHMNVRWYLHVFDDAGDVMVADLFGITMAYHAEHQTGGFDLEHHLHYLKEVHIGDTVAVYPRIVARSAKRVHYLLLMVNETRGTLAAIFECVNSFADLRERRTAPYPDEIAAKIDAVLAQHQALSWAAPTCGIMSA
jgi:acyl-CoA thioester hydrolase